VGAPPSVGGSGIIRSMSFYDEVGVRPFINAGGWMYTRYGGTIMPDVVVAAMAEASKHFVNLFELQDQVGRAIAALTHNEAAFVSCGAASGILLCAAAAIAGTDAEKAARLPDSGGLRNQFIMQRCGRGTEADPVIRAAGGCIVFVGPEDRSAAPAEIFAAVNEQTAAIVLLEFESEGQADAAAVIAGAHERGIPVIIDGACSLPSRKNLWHYTRDLGADAFVTSGGKAIHGPQSTGLVLGKSWIIETCKFHASPNLRIGRGMKVGKEEFAGIYTALKCYLDTDEAAEVAREQRILARIADRLEDLPSAQISLADGTKLQIKLDPAVVSVNTEQVAATLLSTDPSILLSGCGDKITIRANLLQDGEEQIIADRLRQVINASSNL
jgi:L-seryl-tRNA(Ser) seleniumtransferase